MRKLLAILAVLLVAGIASGANIGNKLSTSSAPGSYVSLKAGNAVGNYRVGDAFPLSAIGFTQAAGSAFDGVLWACDTTTPDVSFTNCDQVTLLAANVATFTYQTARRTFILQIITIEDQDPGGLLVVKGTFDQVAEGAGGAGGAGVPPASGVDTELCLLENSDFDGNKVCTVIDATNDLTQNVTHYIGPDGVSGSRWLTSFIDSPIGGHGSLNEWVSWRCGAATNGLPDQCETSVEFEHWDTGHIIYPLTGGGRLKATSLSVSLGQTLAVPSSNRCDFNVLFTDTFPSPSLDPAALIPTGWQKCTGNVFIGPTDTNTGGVGDALLNSVGEHYTIPLSDCECANDHCIMVLAVSDAALNACDQLLDVTVGLSITEVYP